MGSPPSDLSRRSAQGWQVESRYVMEELDQVELIRARWRRGLELEALNATDREDFAAGRLARRLRGISVQLLLQPEDPDRDILSLDERLWTWLEEGAKVDVAGQRVQLGVQRRPTAHAAALVGSYSREPWSSYVAVHRSGAIEIGLGDRGGWDRTHRDDEPVRIINLISAVGYTWSLLELASRLSELGPFSDHRLLTVGVVNTRQALLGNLGEGWAEPGSYENSVGGCAEDHLLWHLELSAPLDTVAVSEIARSVGDRLEDAWGVQQRRYLAHRGDRAGEFDSRRIVQ